MESGGKGIIGREHIDVNLCLSFTASLTLTPTTAAYLGNSIEDPCIYRNHSHLEQEQRMLIYAGPLLTLLLGMHLCVWSQHACRPVRFEGEETFLIIQCSSVQEVSFSTVEEIRLMIFVFPNKNNILNCENSRSWNLSQLGKATFHPFLECSPLFSTQTSGIVHTASLPTASHHPNIISPPESNQICILRPLNNMWMTKINGYLGKRNLNQWEKARFSLNLSHKLSCIHKIPVQLEHHFYLC